MRIRGYRRFKTFSQDAPAVTTELTVDVSTNLTKLLLDSSIDIAFLLGPLPEPSVVNHHLANVPLVWVASPKLGVTTENISITNLAQWPIITYARNTIPYNEIHREFSKSSDRPARIFASSSLAVCRRLVLDAVGVSALPSVVIADDIAAGKVNVINTDWHPSDLSFTASYPMAPHKPEFLPMIELAKSIMNS